MVSSTIIVEIEVVGPLLEDGLYDDTKGLLSPKEWENVISSLFNALSKNRAHIK